MLHALTDIHILDIDHEVSIHDPISKVYQYFSHLRKEDNGFSYIDLSNLNVKIKDWTGWTQLLKIEAYDDIDDWDKLSSPIPLVLKDEIIPIYSPDVSKQGFHGEVKYKYILHEYQYLKGMKEFIVRTIVDDRDDDVWQLFIPMHLESVPNSSKNKVGYKIYTKSGFFNANNIHLCSSDTRIEDGKESWK